ncbi:MAG: L,D-transpeptidase [Propionibacteriaceae bacterium]
MNTTRLTRPALAVTAALAAVALVGGCGVNPSSQGPADGGLTKAPTSSSTSTTSTSSPTPEAVSLSANVDDGAKNVKVDKIVSVAAADGKLSKVSLAYVGTKDDPKKKVSVNGALNDAKTGWTADEALDPGATYTLKMSGTSTAGVDSSSSQTFTTEDLSLDQQTYPTIFPAKGATVGVGMPVILTFDVPVKDKAEFEKHLSVQTTPKQTGTWSWISSTEVHYRPKTYWKPGTKVSVDANLNGVNAGNGIYGQESRSTDFTIGRSLITKINLSTDVAKVYQNDKLVRTIYVSGGKSGWQTRSGIKLIMSKEMNKKMTNEMIGAKENYDLNVKYAMRITNSGEFLHSAPWNAGSFGRTNASHGCVGMSTSDAGWLYDRVLPGDPVETTGSSRGMERVNGWSDWNVSWSTYKKASAL